MSKLIIAKVPAFIATASKLPFSRRIALTVALLLVSSIVTPSASASIQTLSYSCSVMARNVTLNVSPGDVLNFTSTCGAVLLGGYNSNAISSSTGNGFPARSFVVSASLAPGTYVDAIELYTAYHNFYTLVYTSPVSDAEASAVAAKAAAQAAAAKREAEKRDARTEIVRKAINKQALNDGLFNIAEISGVYATNIAAVQADIFALTDSERSNIEPIIKVARKFEIVALIGSDRVSTLSPTPFVEIGLIPETSKFKTSLVVAVRKLPAESRDSYNEIKAEIDAKAAALDSRRDRLASIITRIKSR